MSLPHSSWLSSAASWCATLLIALGLLGTQLTTSTTAQDSAEMSATYGRGVHAFFANQSAEAEQLFTQVAQAGSTDPRVYYFRAMIRLRMGRQHEAEADMRVGAAFEARDPGRRHSIGLALQRIQGPGRRTLERFRREGRLDRVQQRRRQTQQRYEQLERRAPQVLRREAPMQLDLHDNPEIQPAAPAPAPAMAPAQVEVPPVATPFEVGEEAPMLTTPAESNLPVPATTPAPEDDLFSDPAPQPANTQPSAEKPMAEPESIEPADDLFGEPAAPEQAADDLFGDPPAEDSEPPMSEEPAEEEGLFGEPAEPDSGEPVDDLFGDSDSTEPPSDAPTEDDAAGEDPFGEAPAEESDSSEEVDDLFGGTAPKESTPVATLKDDDRVNSGKLFGILGRVVGSAVPWRNIQLPAMSPAQPAAAEADGIALGPDPNSLEEVTPASVETPVEAPAEDDLFGSDTSDSSQEEDAFDSLGDDPFGESEPAMESEPADAFEEEPLDLEEDPFGFIPTNSSQLLA